MAHSRLGTTTHGAPKVQASLAAVKDGVAIRLNQGDQFVSVLEAELTADGFDERHAAI
jgi:hypothetical protein